MTKLTKHIPAPPLITCFYCEKINQPQGEYSTCWRCGREIPHLEAITSAGLHNRQEATK